MLVQNNEYDLFIASKIGSFKHVKYHTDKAKNTKKCIENLQDIKELQKDDSIVCLQWGNKCHTEIIIGRKNNQIQTYSTSKKSFKRSITADYAKGELVGLGKSNGCILSAVSSGIVRLWSKKESNHVDIDTGGPLDKMRLSQDDETLFVTGGNEQDIKLWQVGETTPLFHGKNLPQDWLQLRQPIWVTDCCVMPSTEGKIIACCSRFGYVRLYDIRAQRRPVCNLTFEKMPATCMTPGFDERTVLVGFGRGQMHQVDLRNKGRLDKGYKGSVGAVTDIALIKDSRLIVSTSLDRHLKVHNADTKEMLYKQYMTSKLTAVLVQTESSTPLSVKVDDDVIQVQNDVTDDVQEEGDGDGSDGLDDLFENMETVGDETPSKRKASQDTEDMDDSIRKLLRSTEKKKRKVEEKKKKKKQKSVFHNA